MTIPIEPGPFSFLAGAGQALGAYAQEREKKRQTQIKEASDVLHQMIDLRSKGYLAPEAFNGPEIQRAAGVLGIGKPSGQATAGELKEQGQQSYMSQVLPSVAAGQATDEGRAAFGLPERGQTERVNAGIAQNVAAVPTAQLGGMQAQAQLPEAAPTAIAGQQTTQDKTFNEIADRAVESVFNRSGRKRLPTIEEAFATGQGDPRAQTFGARINQQYYGAAIERLRAKLSAEDIARLNAAARLKGAEGSGQDDAARIYQRNADIAQKELDAHIKTKPNDTDYITASVAKTNREAGKPVNRILGDAEKRVNEWEAKRTELETRLHGYQDKSGDVTGAPVGVSPPSSPPQPNPTRQAAAAEEYRRRTKGVTSAAERQRIAEDIARKQGVSMPGRSPTGGRR